MSTEFVIFFVEHASLTDRKTVDHLMYAQVSTYITGRYCLFICCE